MSDEQYIERIRLLESSIHRVLEVLREYKTTIPAIAALRENLFKDLFAPVDAAAKLREEPSKLPRSFGIVPHDEAPQPQEGGTCTDCELPLPSCKCNVDATAVNEAATPSLSPEMATFMERIRSLCEAARPHQKKISLEFSVAELKELLDALEGKS